MAVMRILCPIDGVPIDDVLNYVKENGVKEEHYLIDGPGAHKYHVLDGKVEPLYESEDLSTKQQIVSFNGNTDQTLFVDPFGILTMAKENMPFSQRYLVIDNENTVRYCSPTISQKELDSLGQNTGIIFPKEQRTIPTQTGEE